MLVRRITVLGVCGLLASSVLAQSTAFTYQGDLKQGSAAANGTYDMRFRLYSAPVGGSQPGPTACVDNVAVTSGKFTATIDVGQQYATGEARYLEIEVRQDTGLNCSNTTGFTLLTPRQLLTAAPKASVAEIAHSLAIPNGSSLNAVALDNSGNVGMGTASPTSHLEIFGIQDALKLRGPQPFMTLVDTASNTRVLLQNEGGRYFVVSESFLNGTNTGGFTMVDQQGRLGLGTFNPTGPLEVRAGNGSYVLVDGINGDLKVNGGADGFFGIFNDGPAGGQTQIIGQGIPRLSVANTGNVGIGAAPNVADRLFVNGNLRVAGTIQSDTRIQRYKTIHGSTFQAEIDSGNDGPFTVRYADGIIGSIPSGAFCGENYYYAPVELPDGAVITNVLFTYYDNGPCGIYGEMYRLNLFSGALNAMVTFPFEDFNGTTVKIVSSSNISNPTVDNSTYAYVLRISMNGPSRASGAYMRVLGARIRYETSIPYP